MDAAKKKTEKSSPSKRPASAPGAKAASAVKYAIPTQAQLLTEMEAKRNELGVSHEKFAVQVLGISSSTYERWLHGAFNPSLQLALRIWAALNQTELLPARMTAVNDPVLAELWDNPLDAVYDNY